MAGATIDETARLIRELADIEAIKQLKARYIRLVDGKKWDEWRALFTPDCRVETEGGVHEGPDDVVASVSRVLAKGTTMHRVTMPEITITGPDSATAIWGQQDIVEMEYKGQPHKFSGWGYYYEEYRRTPEGWRIKSTRLERLGKHFA